MMMGLFMRWFGAFLLLAATFNPTPWNYVSWARANFASQMPVTLLLGLLLGLGYLIYIGATVRSIGTLGVVLLAALFALVVWVLYDWGLFDLNNSALNIWLSILALSFILGIGLSWSILWQRLSGQATVDDTDH
jgi:hypothetical protein